MKTKVRRFRFFFISHIIIEMSKKQIGKIMKKLNQLEKAINGLSNRINELSNRIIPTPYINVPHQQNLTSIGIFPRDTGLILN